MAFTNSAQFTSGGSQALRAFNSPTLAFVGPMTLEAWVNPTATAFANQAMIMSGYGTGSSGIQWYFDPTGHLVLICDSPSLTAPASTGAVPAGVFTHVATTVDGANVNYYINGVLDSTFAFAGVNDAYTSSFALGNFDNNGTIGGADMDGSIGMARLWSTVRTAPQILSNYCAALGATAGLSGEWVFDGTLNDNSGNGNTLTNIGGVTFPLTTPGVCTPSTFTTSNRRLI